MATTKPKVKRMMFGGAAGALGGVKNAVAAKAGPMLQQAKQLQAAASKAPPNQTTFVGGKPRGPMVPPKQMATMSDSQREGYAKQLNQSMSQLRRPIGGAEAQKLGLSAGSKTGLGDAMRGLGAGAAGVARGIAASDLKRAGLMKKGGAVKSSASKRGDGIAQRGKTKGRSI